MKQKFEKLLKKRDEAKLGGGADKIKAQHEKNKLTARERIELLVDEWSFQEIDMFVTHRSTDFGLEKQKYAGDGVVTGFAKNQRQASCNFQPRLYRIRRIVIGSACRKNM